jgi:hypothetical protein
VQAAIRDKQQSIKAYLVDLITTSKENLDYIQEVNSDQVLKDEPEIITLQVEPL